LNYIALGLVALFVGGVALGMNKGSAEDRNNTPDQDQNRNDDPAINPNDPFDDPSFEYFRNKQEVKDFLTDYEVLARTLYGESRSSPEYEKKKIAMVILNRVNSYKFPNSIKGVCLEKYQFSCWNELYNPNDNYYDNSSKVLKASLNNSYYNECLRIAKEVINCYSECNDIPDVYNYILNTDDVMITDDNIVGLSYASWSLGMKVAFKGKDHIFIKEENRRYV